MSYQFNDGGRKAAGFKGKTGDCGVRAIAIALELDYRTVYDSIMEIGKGEKSLRSRSYKKSHPRKGTWTSAITDFVTPYGWVWTPTMKVGQGTRVHVRKDELPSGSMILRLSRHYCAFVDGVVHDIYDGSRDGTRCVYGYWSKGDRE